MKLLVPNSYHIDRVIAHAHKYPHKWRHIQWTAARSLARIEAKGRLADYAVQLLVLRVAQIDVGPGWTDRAPSIVTAIEDALLALCTWHDCAYMLDLHPDVVRTLAGSGNHAAALLLPGIIAMNGDDDESHSTSAEGARPEAV